MRWFVTMGLRGLEPLTSSLCQSTVRRARQVYNDVKNGDYATAGPDFLATAESAAGVALAVGKGLAEAKTAEPGGLVAGCMNSFVGSTEVLVQGDRKEPIEAVKVGDSVTTGVPGKAATEQHVVTAVHVTDADRDFVELVIGTPAGARTITATAHHRFYDVSLGNWVDAVDLHVGDELDTPGEGRAPVVSARHFVAGLRTYNLAVDAIHTYYVVAGESPVLVHNVGECPVNGPPHRKLGEAGTLDRLIREGWTNITPDCASRTAEASGSGPISWHNIRTEGGSRWR
ncbi:polymorphic toxin-type HINT domain-containing protein [Amycolatopsis mongoliensis]|uniref:Polymorphic toxin-type HINT domain-containing protein n=1 Tax=Amycolatopsis mongoliensis TaxID=715475 RepID=A0A9Y2NFH6_9PSEU|nr:Hint domain-containing protein [Amycolatopsis sp. 4-36]WIY02957.1 polymorphic toxin-type HINT domain-containing protein [Amycolatopsis sp. 4-36]